MKAVHVYDELFCQNCGVKMEMEIHNEEPIYWCENCDWVEDPHTGMEIDGPS